MRLVDVRPDIERPTHHVSLSDGDITIGLIARNAQGVVTAQSIRREPIQRTAMKTTTGDVTYSDMNWPWMVLSQTSWSLGRGYNDFERDKTRYYDSKRADTSWGNIFLGPQEVYTTGYRSQILNLPGSMEWLGLTAGANRYVAARVIPTADITVREIYLWLRKRGEPADLVINLCTVANDAPDTVLQSATISAADLPDIVSELVPVAITDQALSNGVEYFIELVAGDSDDDTNHWEVGVKNEINLDVCSSDQASWSILKSTIYYRLVAASQSASTMFFNYRYSIYALQQFTSGNPKLYLNSDRGIADANTGALNTLIDGTKTWTEGEFANCVVMIIGGTGLAEKQNWRKITWNTATTLNVDTPWTITHDTTTEYVILGQNHWREVTGHGLTNVTDILVVNNIVYFAQGDATVMRRMHWNNSTAVHDFADDGTNKASYLATVRDSKSGLVVWRGNNDDTNHDISVSKATVQNWGSNLSFGTALPMKDDYGRINRLIEYGDEEKDLWIMREGMVFKTAKDSSQNDILDKINLEELKTVMESTNGKAAIVHNVYLIFSLSSGIERYYDRNLDDVGMNRDEGLPENRRGICVDLLGYPGRYMAAYRSGGNGYSSVYLQSGGGSPGSGWHELYRAPYGKPIQDLAFQTIPGDTPDRLWIAQEDDILWLYMPSRVLDPSKDTNYRYTHEASVESGWITGGLADIWKLFNTAKIIGERISPQSYIEMDYKADDEEGWHTIADVFDKSPDKEISLNEDLGVNAKRFKWRVRLQTKDNTQTPIIKSIILEAIGLISVKYSFQLPYKMEDQDYNLNGEQDEYSGVQKQEILDEWASSLKPLTMRCVRKLLDNKMVFIDPTPLTVSKDFAESYIGNLLIVER